MLAALAGAPWKPSPAAGAGGEYRSARHPSVLTYGGAVVYGGLVVAG